MKAWWSARASSIDQLKALEEAIRASRHADADRAVVIIRAIRANLTETPRTTEQINELRDFIGHDDIFPAIETPNVFGVHVNIRAPLLNALASVKAE